MSKVIKVVKTGRQARVSIPTDFLDKLEIGDYVLVELKENHIEIHPAEIRMR